jgi:hypothetical protein
MAARDVALLASGVIVGAAVAGAIGFGLDWNLFGDTTTAIDLRVDSGACTVTGKQTEVQVKKNRKLTFRVKNHCDATVTVAVGNFRTSVAAANTDCQNATEGGATSPFTQDDEARRTAEDIGPGSDDDPTEKKIELKVKKREELGNDQLTYYFGICLGKRPDQRVVDPRLIIER